MYMYVYICTCTYMYMYMYGGEECEKEGECGQFRKGGRIEGRRKEQKGRRGGRERVGE